MSGLPPPAALSKREGEVLVALKPWLNADRRFSHTIIARKLDMTRQLFNLYLTKLTRARAIVRIGRGMYVWPSDPRAKDIPPPPLPAKLLPKEIRKALAAPITVPGITLGMLMSGRAWRKRRVIGE